MAGEKRTPAPEGNGCIRSKTEARRFIQSVQRLTEIAQARLTGTLEGGIAMWEMLNAENLQKQ